MISISISIPCCPSVSVPVTISASFSVSLFFSLVISSLLSVSISVPLFVRVLRRSFLRWTGRTAFLSIILSLSSQCNPSALQSKVVSWVNLWHACQINILKVQDRSTCYMWTWENCSRAWTHGTGGEIFGTWGQKRRWEQFTGTGSPRKRAKAAASRSLAVLPLPELLFQAAKFVVHRLVFIFLAATLCILHLSLV